MLEMPSQSLPDVASLSEGKLKITENKMWYVIRPNDLEFSIREYRRILGREEIDRFIDNGLNPQHESILEMGRRVIEYQRTVLKVHLKLPIKYKNTVLKSIARAAAGGEVTPMFKMYKDADEIDEDREYPDRSIASFVFYFGEDPHESRDITLNKMVAFITFLAKILRDQGISDEMKTIKVLVPRFSFQTKFEDGNEIGGITVTQGDADFKTRCLFQDIGALLNPEVNFAFFHTDNEELKKVFTAIPSLGD